MRLVTENEEYAVALDAREPMTGISSLAAPSRFLIVALDGRYLALDAESIAGVCTLGEAGYRDDPTIHNMACRTIDLADRLGISKSQDTPNTRIVLLAEGGTRGSIRVTAIQGLLELDRSQVLPIPPQFHGPERHWYRGMILFEKSIALALNIMWVLNEPVSNTAGSEGEENTSRPVAIPQIAVSDGRVC